MSKTYYSNERNEMLKFLPKNLCRVLEIGCGSGKFRDHFSQDCEYWGVELNSNAASEAAKVCTQVFNMTFENAYAKLPNEYFDLIICNDVIEHFVDHQNFFCLIKEKMLPEKSYIVGSIPNVRYITNMINYVFKKDWEYTQDGILDKTHLRFFTHKSLLRLFSDCGFSIDTLEGINQYDIKSKKIKKRIINSVYLLLSFVLGQDTKYLQFGFRIKIKN